MLCLPQMRRSDALHMPDVPLFRCGEERGRKVGQVLGAGKVLRCRK
jgi:hypothetical protein